LALTSGAEFVLQTDFCSNQSIPAQGSCSIAIQLTPTSQADYTDTLTIPSNDSTQNPLTVALSGKGRVLDARINQIKTDGCGLGFLRLLVSVTGLAGIPRTGLAPPNFELYENGVLKNFILDNTANVPISVGLVLDYSGSLSSGDRTAIQDAAKSFVDTLAPGDEVGVIKFALTIGQNTPFSTDLNSVKNAIDLPYQGDTGGTILYDALLTAIDDTALRNDRRAIIVFSDGNDEESTSTLAAVIDQANLKGVPIFAIAYTNATAPKPEVMQQLAQETGGEYFAAPSSSDLAVIYPKISTILSEQYLIEFTTSSSGGTTVSVDVLVTDGPDLGEDSRDGTGC
jgi:VWFA-related protein